MAEEKQSFIIYKSWATLLVGLSEEEVGQIMKAVCSKELGQEYEITNRTAQAVFNMIAPQLDEDTAKYQAKCEKSKASANKRWGNKEECERNANASKKNANAMPTHTNALPTHGDNDNDSESDNDIDIDTPNGVYKASAKADARDTRVPRSDVEAVIAAWNDLPAQVPKIHKLVDTSTRMKLLKARIKGYGVDKVLEAIKSVRDSPFLLGERTDFTITFDWFIGPKNFPKVLDGNYLDRARSGTTYGMSQQELDEGAARIEAAMALERGELYGEQ